MSKILISNVEIVTDGPDYKKKYIGITGNTISYIGTRKPKGYEDAYQIDGSGKLSWRIHYSFTSASAAKTWLNTMLNVSTATT